MTLYLIGLSLHDEKDISIKGLEIVKQCDVVYLENYTSLLSCSWEDLNRLYGKKIIPCSRERAEQGMESIVEEARTKKVAFLVVGDPFSATTHIELFRLAKEKKVPIQVVHNASVITAVGITGLQLYKFGRTASIPFPEDVPDVEAPYDVLKDNHNIGLHTLFLLDLKPEKNEFLTISQALQILENIEGKRKKGKRGGLITDSLLVVGCARLGADDYTIKAGPLAKIKKVDFGQPPYCLIVPGKLHFMEEEMVGLWK